MTTVLKLGGTSVGSVARVKAAVDLICRYAESTDVVVVVSAMGSTTDELLRLAREAGSDGPCRETDQLLSTGELVSAAALALALRERGVAARSLSGGQAGFRVSGPAGEGRIRWVDPGPVRELLRGGEIPVVAGFQGVDETGTVVTLGRGGSDTTAVALAASLDAEECVIFTDVPGVRSADPRVVPDAGHHASLEGEVMVEMAFAGARVLHPRAVELASAHGIDIRLRSSMDPDHPGTLVVAGSTHQDSRRPTPGSASADAVRTHHRPDLESAGPVGVAHDADVARILIHGLGGGDRLVAEVLTVFGQAAAPIDLVARSGANEPEFRLGFTMRSGDLPRVRTRLASVVAGHDAVLEVDDAVGKVSLVGRGLATRPEVAATMLGALAREGIATSWVSTTTMRVSAVVDRARLADVVQLLHAEFGLGDGTPPESTSPAPADAPLAAGHVSGPRSPAIEELISGC